MKTRRALVMAYSAIAAIVPQVASGELPKPPEAVAAPRPAAPAPKTLDRTSRVSVEATTGFVAAVDTRFDSGPEREPSAMVRETRELDLPAGSTEIVWEDLPDTLRSETTDVRVPPGVTLVAQRFEETMPGPVGLAALLHGREAVAHPRHASDEPYARERSAAQSWKGSIVSLDGGVVLRVGSSLTVLPPSEVNLVDPAKGAPKRRLVLVLSTSAPVRARLAVTGLVTRIVPHGPRYTLALDRTTHEARVRGTVTVTNGSSLDLSGARLFLGRTAFEPHRDRPFGSPPDLARTWLSRETATGGREGVPFEVVEPLRFSTLAVAEPVIVDASHVPYVERSTTSLTSLDAVHEKPDGPLRLPISLAWTLDERALGGAPDSPLTLPSGEASLTEATSGAPPEVLAHAVLYRRSSPRVTEVEVLARTTSLFVEAKFLGGSSSGNCAKTTKWEYSIPASLLSRGPFVLELPFEKRRLEARLGKVEGATMELVPDGTSRLVVTPLPKESKPLGAAEVPARRVVVTYKTNPCP